jgi:predicted DNA-binding transcriptional regulator AlpA
MKTDSSEFLTHDCLYTTDEISEILNISKSSICNSRSRKSETMIPYVKIGRSVRYRSNDIEKFLLGRRIV